MNKTAQQSGSTHRSGPFSLEDEASYAEWRGEKLRHASPGAAIGIADPTALTESERNALLSSCTRRNFTLFRFNHPPADIEARLQAFGRQMGLLDFDQNLCADDSGLTAITVRPTHTDHVYIPYTSRPLGWHTDGYYNAGHYQVRAWLLYCVQPAAEGGANELFDHEIAYIRLRDQNPDWIRALTADDAFTIPGNLEGGELIRPDHSGPVFSISPDGSLHMRYSARQRNVIWKDDPVTQAAATFLRDLFERGDEFIFRHRLNAGEGLISNNALHRRDGFRDADNGRPQRLIYRARYHQRLPCA